MILALIRELATYERSASSVVATEPLLAAALFGPSPAVFCHVAESADGEVVGFALWFLNFSTWLGRHGIWLEDLYVRPTHRGLGLGKALLATLTSLAAERGYGRVEWWVLDGLQDTPGGGPQAFYRSQGAHPEDAWTVWRMDADTIAALAAGEPVPDEGPGLDEARER